MNDDLIIKYLLKETNSEEEAQVKDWMAASPDNEKEFLRFELIWSHSKKLEEESSLSTELAWDSFKKRVASSKPNQAQVRSISRRYSWLKVAAVLFVVAGAWSFYSVFNSGYDTIKAGEMVRTETLPDGSEITLNKNTTVSYRKNFNGETRSVKLENGEAFFKVQPDKAKPFLIEADRVTVRVVGTSFNVKHVEGSTEVIVETGIVHVAVGNHKVELKPGEKVSVRDGLDELRKEQNIDKLYNYYSTKVLVADDTPLWRVVEILNETYSSNITIENKKNRDLLLNATFKDQPIDTIVNIIAKTFKISAVKEDGKIVLR